MFLCIKTACASASAPAHHKKYSYISQHPVAWHPCIRAEIWDWYIRTPLTVYWLPSYGMIQNKGPFPCFFFRKCTNISTCSDLMLFQLRWVVTIRRNMLLPSRPETKFPGIKRLPSVASTCRLHDQNNWQQAGRSGWHSNDFCSQRHSMFSEWHACDNRVYVGIAFVLFKLTNLNTSD